VQSAGRSGGSQWGTHGAAYVRRARPRGPRRVVSQRSAHTRLRQSALFPPAVAFRPRPGARVVSGGCAVGGLRQRVLSRLARTRGHLLSAATCDPSGAAQGGGRGFSTRSLSRLGGASKPFSPVSSGENRGGSSTFGRTVVTRHAAKRVTQGRCRMRAHLMRAHAAGGLYQAEYARSQYSLHSKVGTPDIMNPAAFASPNVGSACAADVSHDAPTNAESSSVDPILVRDATAYRCCDSKPLLLGDFFQSVRLYVCCDMMRRMRGTYDGR